MEEWELKYYQDWRELERELNKKVYIGELVIHEIKKEDTQPKYYLNIQERTIPIFEFHLKESPHDFFISELSQALKLVNNYVKIGIEKIYITPSKICSEYPTAGADKREKLVYLPSTYLFLPYLKLSLHIWHENIHLLLPVQENKIDDSEEFIVKKLSHLYGKIIMGKNWNPEHDLSSCGTDELKWNKKTVSSLLELLESHIKKDVLERVQKEIIITKQK